MNCRLSYCNENSDVKIVELQAGKEAYSNLNSLGLSLKDELRILKNSKDKGPVTVQKNKEKINIGRKFSNKLIVECKNPNLINLVNMQEDDEGEVIEITATGEIRRRLMDMGIVKGAIIKTIRKAPLGDPIEIKMNAFTLSLRINEAETIMIKPIKLASYKPERNSFLKKLLNNKI